MERKSERKVTSDRSLTNKHALRDRDGRTSSRKRPHLERIKMLVYIYNIGTLMSVEIRVCGYVRARTGEKV